MNDLWERLRFGMEQLAGVLPAFGGALLILVAGYFVARTVERWADSLLRKLGFAGMAAGTFTEAVERTGLRADPAHAVGKLLFWLVMLVVILLSSTALGLESINRMFGTILSFMPQFIAGIVIVILGMIVGEFVRGLVLASAGGVEGVPTLAKFAKIIVVTIAVFMALQQVGVSPEIITATFTLVLGAVALAAGLAFGLGSRDLAGEITRRWYEQGRLGRRRRKEDREREREPQA